MKKKPNILFFFTDDQRFDTISALGNPEIKTPNLDEFAQDSVVFTHAHIMGGSCGAVCMPSRAMLQTGRDLFSLYGQGRQNGAFIPTEHTMLPEYLRNNGYLTHHIGKWHQDKDAFMRAYDNADTIFGFVEKEWYGTQGGHYNPLLMDFDPSGRYENEKGYNFDENYQKIPIKYGTGKIHSTDIFCDYAVQFIENYSDEKPFYLYVATVAPHDPRNAPDEYADMYESKDISLPQNYMPVHPFDNGDLYLRDEQLENFPRPKRAIKNHIADYYGMISHIDARFGDVVKSLKENGMYDDTIIIFSADNGLALGRHGLMGKQNMYEHTLRVPLMIKPTGEFERGRNDSYVYLFDIFPTLCEMLDLPVPDSVNGSSFKQVVDNTTRIARKELFAAYRNLQRCYKDDTYKIIEYYVNGGCTTQLFDIVNDPHELENLAENNDYSLLLESMREKLYEARVRYNDPTIIFPKDLLAVDIW